MENQEVKPETTTPETPATPEQPVSPTGGPPKKTKPKWIVPAIIVAGIIILGAAAVILLTECCVDRRYEQDSRRIGDLRIITLALEMYYDDYGRFPENLEELEQEPAYIAKTPKDPKSEEVYKYVLIEDNKVILRTILDNTNNSILAEDEDGTISGLDCQDPAYCLIYETKEVNDNCAKEGESPTYLDLTTGLEVPDGKYCCSGLKAIGPKTSQAQLEKGMCAKITGSLGVCRPCGNDVCDSNYEDACNCPEDCELDETADSKIYRNEKYGFELEYPSYYNSINESSTDQFEVSGVRPDWFGIKIHKQPIDGFEYKNQSGAFSFIYDANTDNWAPTQEGVSQNFAPTKHTAKNGNTFFAVTMADAASVGEIAFIESLMKDYVVEVYTFRNMSYLDCIEPCPYAIPFSDDKTILPIIDTIKFY